MDANGREGSEMCIMGSVAVSAAVLGVWPNTSRSRSFFSERAARRDPQRPGRFALPRIGVDLRQLAVALALPRNLLAHNVIHPDL
jgi:hypothetical protein